MPSRERETRLGAGAAKGTNELNYILDSDSRGDTARRAYRMESQLPEILEAQGAALGSKIQNRKVSLMLPTFDPEHAPALSEWQKNLAREISNSLRMFNCGSQNAVKSATLELEFGVRGPLLRAMIHYLRGEGCPICSSGQGYFWASNRTDVLRCIAHLQARRNSIQDVINSLEAIV